jgi:hypothetical protein
MHDLGRGGGLAPAHGVEAGPAGSSCDLSIARRFHRLLLLPSLPPPRQRSVLWPIIVRLTVSYLFPLLGTIVLLARHALARLWEALLAAF